MGDQALLKKKAAERAVEFVQSGMVVGLGTGSTTGFALELIGEATVERYYRNTELPSNGKAG